MKPLSQRNTILIGGAVFFAAVAAAWFVGKPEEPVQVAAVAAARRPAQAATTDPTTSPPALVPTPREPAPTDAPAVVDIFATKSWVPPPPPPPPPGPPPPPEAPPLPFSLLGVMKQELGKNVYYLARGEQAYGVTDGETIDGAYRINGLRGQQLSFTYLPMRKEQTLPLPAGDTSNQVVAPSSGAPNASGPAPRGFLAPNLPVPSSESGPRPQPAPASRGRPESAPAEGRASPGAKAAAAPARSSQPSMFSPPPTFDMERAVNPGARTEAEATQDETPQD